MNLRFLTFLICITVIPAGAHAATCVGSMVNCHENCVPAANKENLICKTDAFQCTDSTTLCPFKCADNATPVPDGCECSMGAFGVPNENNPTSCTSCTPGTFKAAAGNDACVACITGSYSAAGAAGCTSCLAGKTTSGSGTSIVGTPCSPDCEKTHGVAGVQSWAPAGAWTLAGTTQTVTNCVIASCYPGYNLTGAGTNASECVPKTYTVALNQAGGTGGTTSVTATFNKPLPTGQTAPMLTGHTFGGYWSVSGGTGDQYYLASMTPTATVWNTDGIGTIHAKWTPNTITIQYNNNGGSGTASNGDLLCTYGGTYSLSTGIGFTNSGNVFTGWAKDSAGTQPVPYNGACSDLATSGSVTLWAQWIPCDNDTTGACTFNPGGSCTVSACEAGSYFIGGSTPSCDTCADGTGHPRATNGACNAAGITSCYLPANCGGGTGCADTTSYTSDGTGTYRYAANCPYNATTQLNSCNKCNRRKASCFKINLNKIPVKTFYIFAPKLKPSL